MGFNTGGRRPTGRRVAGDHRRIVAALIAAVATRALLFAAVAASTHAQAPASADMKLLRRMLVAEDARGHGTEGVAPLLDALKGKDSTLRRVAIRALGRLQDLRQSAVIVPGLDDASPAIRIESANALAQAAQNYSRPRAPGSQSPDDGAAFGRTIGVLLAHLQSESNPLVIGVIARSLGRLPVADSVAARNIEQAIHQKVSQDGARADAFLQLPAAAQHDVAEGLYTLARARRRLGTPSREAVDLMRAAAHSGIDARTRRVGLLGLDAAGALDSTTVLVATGDADPQVRRLALAGVGSLSPASHAAVARRALADTSAMVRVDAIRALRTGTVPPDCTPIVAATRDPDPHVMLTAIDALGAACADGAARTAALNAIASSRVSANPGTVSGHATWHAPAHAIVALARADSAAAAGLLPTFVADREPHVREYAARAAAVLKNAPALFTLARDPNHNVQDAAITGLAQVRKHDADTTYIRALASPGYQVVLAAAAALAGSRPTATVPALFTALDRISAERRENSRDPRIGMLTRIAELGAPADAPRLRRYLTDYDTTVAAKAAEILTKWTGTAVAPRAAPLPIRAEPLAETFAARGLRLRITMDKASGGGSFDVQLFPDEAPATVARLVRLARAHYFDGLTFHRIATNFVLQGGSPDAVEFVGDGPFMRDELALRSHDRGTLGISTRGRDTGDAQLFVNVVDNPRLDHDYTVFGMIVSGMPVVDQVIEGDVMAKVEVIGGR